jgi:hypothetical protein
MSEAAANLKKIERLQNELIATRRKLVSSLSVKFSPAVLASLATVGLAISQIEAVLRESRSN